MWTGTDEYLDGIWQRYQRALKLIEQFKESPVEDIRFIAEYLEELIKDNGREQDENTKRFKVINLLSSQRDKYIRYADYLEHRIRVLTPNDRLEMTNNILERKRKDLEEDYYNKRYHEKELELSWTNLWMD